jgi:hypothetical protein
MPIFAEGPLVLKVSPPACLGLDGSSTRGVFERPRDNSPVMISVVRRSVWGSTRPQWPIPAPRMGCSRCCASGSWCPGTCSLWPAAGSAARSRLAWPSVQACSAASYSRTAATRAFTGGMQPARPLKIITNRTVSSIQDSESEATQTGINI